MSRVTELVFRGTDRSVVRTLNRIGTQSDQTSRKLDQNSRTASSSFERMGKSSRTLQGGLSSLTGLIGLGGVAFGIKDVIQGGMQLQSQQAQLQAALRSTGQAGAGVAERLTQAAESMSTKGGFATPQNLTALTAFIRETHDATQAQSMLSLSTDIARGRNIDLATAQTVVQRAYTGQIGRLQQLIGPMVAVKSAQFGMSQSRAQDVLALQAQAKAMGKAGPAWLAQQKAFAVLTPQQRALAQLQDKHATALQILSAAQTAFGGSTAAYANTTQGKLSNLKNSVQNLTDNLGKALLPTVNKVATEFAKLAGFFAKHQKLTKDLVIATGILAVTFGGLKIMQGLAGMSQALGIAFAGQAAAEDGAAASSGILAVAMDAIPILALVAGIALLVTHWKEVQRVATVAWRWIKSAAMDTWNWIKGHWPLLAGILLFPITGPAGIIVGLFHKQILGAVKDTWNWIKGAWKTLFDVLTWPFRTAWNVIRGIGQKIGGVFHSIVGTAGSVLNTISFGALHSGGVVRPKYFAGGGPTGNDTIPGWLSKGEGVVNTTGMRILGSGGLNALNHGGVPGAGGGEYVTAPIQLRVDGRVLAELVTRAALRRAARGPSSLVGGSLATGVASPITVS